MHGYYWNWGHGPFWGGGPFMIVFWIVIIFVTISLIKAILKGKTRQESALDILKKRYATSEITKDEFNLMRKEIQS
jgi:putative membrane protein